jgi:hypothetical protein
MNARGKTTGTEQVRKLKTGEVQWAKMNQMNQMNRVIENRE